MNGGAVRLDPAVGARLALAFTWRLAVKRFPIVLSLFALWVVSVGGGCAPSADGPPESTGQPNILIAISDDQSFPHASAYGATWVQTPAFDRVAREGVLFTQAFSPSPGCSPTRAALLTGRHTWMIEHAGTHASSFDAKYVTMPDLLEGAGYFVGYTGKGWGPGNWKDFRPRNPAGPVFEGRELEPPYSGMSSKDYAANFSDFLAARPEGKPFYFWYGGHETHRKHELDSWKKAGKDLDDVEVPPFLPDNDTIRGDVADYGVEIEWFDEHLGRMIEQLEAAGELDNTLIIVTSDNGMPFPRAKANLYEYGTHMPLAIRWPEKTPGGRQVQDLIGFVDLTATVLDAAGVTHPGGEYPLAGRSIMPILTSDEDGIVDPAREAVYSARERHSSSRWDNLAYPQRSIRTHDYLYIRNFKPERWPAGAPQKFDEPGKLGPEYGGYHDIDASPSLTHLVEGRNDPARSKYFHWAVDHRPAEELFDIRKDPGCLENLADDPDFASVKQELWGKLEAYLRVTGDARVTGDGDIWETYKRYSALRSFPKPDWAN